MCSRRADTAMLTQRNTHTVLHMSLLIREHGRIFFPPRRSATKHHVQQQATSQMPGHTLTSPARDTTAESRRQHCS